MQPKEELTTARLRAPRAAAIAGILFAILRMAGLGLIRLAVPANPNMLKIQDEEQAFSRYGSLAVKTDV